MQKLQKPQSSLLFERSRRTEAAWEQALTGFQKGEIERCEDDPATQQNYPSLRVCRRAAPLETAPLVTEKLHTVSRTPNISAPSLEPNWA